MLLAAMYAEQTLFRRRRYESRPNLVAIIIILCLCDNTV
jgi:hypothetical protein